MLFMDKYIQRCMRSKDMHPVAHNLLRKSYKRMGTRLERGNYITANIKGTT